ncbi:MAG: cyclic-di-AMP receptor [Chloroflexota bacterium]
MKNSEMKLIMAVLRDEVTEAVTQSLITSGFRVTRIASTGGFLRRGSTTLMIGVDDGKVEQAIELMRRQCPAPTEGGQKYVTLFVLHVAHFEQL